jgi:ABC-type transporter Mla maintaining outer membrane lipid asymmetry ATPase subunit MlaF
LLNDIADEPNVRCQCGRSACRLSTQCRRDAGGTVATQRTAWPRAFDADVLRGETIVSETAMHRRPAAAADGLSPVVVDSMIETIKLLHEKRGLTILIVEQNVGVAVAVASTAHILKDREIVFSGDAPKLINDRNVLSSYLGR